MREQEEARPKITTDGVRRKICCFGMGWWGCAKREQLIHCNTKSQCAAATRGAGHSRAKLTRD